MFMFLNTFIKLAVSYFISGHLNKQHELANQFISAIKADELNIDAWTWSSLGCTRYVQCNWTFSTLCPPLSTSYNPYWIQCVKRYSKVQCTSFNYIHVRFYAVWNFNVLCVYFTQGLYFSIRPYSLNN